MKILLPFLAMFLTLPAFAAPLAEAPASGKGAGNKLAVARAVMALYQKEMAKPSSPLSQAMKAIADEGNPNPLSLEATDIILLNGNGGHDSHGMEGYSSEYLFPIYQGWKQSTSVVIYLKVSYFTDFTTGSISIDGLADIDVKVK